jgi:hypothetical protein
MKLYERCIGFVKIVITTIPDDQMAKIKVVSIENLWNFIVEPFIIWITFINEKYVWISRILNFKFLKRPRMGKRYK